MKKLKGVEEFVYVLVAAIIVLVVLMLIFSWGPMPTEEYVSVAQFSLIGSIGYVIGEPSRIEPLGSFTVGITQTETLKSVPQLQVIAGVLGGDIISYDIDVPDYMLPVTEKVKINFRVYDTNQYGNLIIKWNGLEFFNELAGLTDYSLVIGPEYVEESNTLEIQCTGPSAFMFWASTVYTLQDFEVEAEYGPATMIPFQLTQTELGSLNKVELVFTGTADSTLNIKVNENSVYNLKPSGSVEVEFSPSTVPLSVGNNIVSFNIGTGTANLQNVELKVYLTTNIVTRTRSFNLTQTQYTYLQQNTMQGVIEYEIEDIIAQGNIEIKLNGHVLNTPLPQEGTNTVYFDADEAQEGDNTLGFTGTGEFDIGTVSVGLEL